ncbi:MAG: hypothetical protein ACPGJI_02835 [Kangiellaceae bacterium]
MKALISALFLILLFQSHNPSAATLSSEHMWPQNSLLNVVFLDGNKDHKALVQSIADQWLSNTNLSFKFFLSAGDAPAKTHIRISFKSHSGSQLGNQKNLLSKEPTMNLFDLTSRQISNSGARRLILHEFGHALGFEHEFRNPNWPYKIEVLFEVVKQCIPKMERMGYSIVKAKSHCDEINRKLEANKTLSTAYDQNSIMNYALEFVGEKGNPVKIKANSELSYLDKYAIQKWYPKN